MSLLPVGIGGARSGYEIEKSLRFRESASAYLSRTPSASNRKTWTWSGWVKRGVLASAQTIFSGGVTSGVTTTLHVAFGATDVIVTSSDTVNFFTGTRVLRDPSAWYHLVLTMDTTNAVADDRIKVYINGVRDTRASGTDITLNADTGVNSAAVHRQGARTFSTPLYTDGYISEINFIDGQALGPSYFGKTDPVTGQWVPKKYTGSYGTNGFYLDFKDGTSLTTLGYDKSGNSNNWTLNNISLTAGITYDWMEDTPSNNFSVLNPLSLINSNKTYSYANLRLTATSGIQWCDSSFEMPSGKWYFEMLATTSGIYPGVGVWRTSGAYTGTYLGFNTDGVAYFKSGNVFRNDSILKSYNTYTTNDIIGVAFDADAGEIYFSKNGVWQGSSDPSTNINPAATGLTDTNWSPALNCNGSSGATADINFGQRPFAYTPPTGFKALCTKNLPAPQVANGADYFDVVLNTGANIKTASEALFGNFLEWIKDRANVNNHQLIDSVRGSSAVLQSNTTAAETTYSAPSGNSVGWVWRASDSAAVTNNNGSISSQVSANVTAGFSIVTYTGNTVAGATVGHGLGIAPKFVIVKNRNGSGVSWWSYHSGLTSPAYAVALDLTGAQNNTVNFWNNTAPDSSKFTLGYWVGGVNTLTNYVAYCFAEIAGYSKFGSYTGNGSADGPFVYCGFKPKYVMIKCSSTTGDWWMYDAERSPANPVVLKLLANSTAVEDVAGEDVDLLSNGFKIRSTAAGQNTNAATYIFAAFAECPFSVATAR